MKSFVVCVLLIALVGVGLCGRLRRQAPPAGVPMPAGVSPQPIVNGPASAKEVAQNKLDAQQAKTGSVVPADAVGAALDSVVPDAK